MTIGRRPSSEQGNPYSAEPTENPHVALNNARNLGKRWATEIADGLGKASREAKTSGISIEDLIAKRNLPVCSDCKGHGFRYSITIGKYPCPSCGGKSKEDATE